MSLMKYVADHDVNGISSETSSHQQTPFFDNVDELQQHVGLNICCLDVMLNSSKGINMQDILKLKVFFYCSSLLGIPKRG